MFRQLIVPAALMCLATLGSPALADSRSSKPGVAETKPEEIRVASYNVNFAMVRDASTVKAIGETDADIVIVQEVSVEWQNVITQKYRALYPHREFSTRSRGATGLAILSKFPIKSFELIPPHLKGWSPVQRAEVETPIGLVQVINLHLRPAIDGTWARGFFTTPKLRLAEVNAYLPKFKKMPTIIGGDLNETAGGQAISKLIEHGFVRSTPAKDSKSTWSFHGRAEGVDVDLDWDIDHLLTTNDLVTGELQVLERGKSDHRPLVTTVRRTPVAASTSVTP